MRNVVLCAALLVCGAVPSAAQVSNPRVFISVNGGIQPAQSDLSDRFTFDAELETASVDVDYPFEQATIIDVGGAVRFWKRLAAGVAVSSYSRDGSAAVDASIPHPFFFEQPREVTGDAIDITRSETAVHAQLMYIVTTGDRLRVLVSAGPSRIAVEQDIVTGVRYDESFPFDTATFRSAATRSFTGSKIGFNVGADVGYMFTRMFGVGGMVRFSRADMDLDGPDNRSISVQAGGVQAGAGIRVVF
jgi:opacity protein-like surface antigen